MDELQNKPAIEVHSIMLSEGGIEISYVEEEDINRASGILKIRTIMIPRALVTEEVAELVEAAQAVVDAGLVADRAPAATFSRRR